MCRLMCYAGSPILLADVLTWPRRSIIKQSYDARERLLDPTLPSHLGHGNLNGDGFGIGWYGDPSESGYHSGTPCVFTSVTPAWNNINLDRLAKKVVSPLIFGHVRAAYPGMPVSEQNCHPFQVGRFMWMHNGVVGGFARIKRAILSELSSAAFDTVQSFHSDSAISFALFLHHLGVDENGHVPPCTAKQMLCAIECTIDTLMRLQREAGVQDELSLLNFVVSDGSSVVATRFVWPESCGPSSLYYTEASEFHRSEDLPGGLLYRSSWAHPRLHVHPRGGLQYHVLRHGDKCSRMCIIASEPITGSSLDWIPVPKNHALVVTKDATGIVNVAHCPLGPTGAHLPRREDTGLCLDALAEGSHTPSRSWLARQKQLHPKRPPVVARGIDVPGSRHSLDCSVDFARSVAGTPWGSYARHDGVGSLRDATLRQSHHSPTVGSLKTADAEVLMRGMHKVKDGTPGGGGGGVAGFGGPGGGPGDGPEVTLGEDAILEGHTQAVQCLALHGKRLFSSSMDCSIQVWDLETYANVGTLEGHSMPVLCLLVEPPVLFSCAGRTVRVWCLATLSCHRVVSLDEPSSRSMVMSMCYGSEGELWVARADARVEKYAIDLTGFADSAVAPPDEESTETCSPEVFTCNTSAHAHAGAVMCVKEVRGFVVSASTDSTLRVWRKEDLSHVKTLRGHRGAVLTLACVGELLLSGGRDNAIRVWDLDGGACCRRTLLGHESDILHLSSAYDPRMPSGLVGAPDLPCARAVDEGVTAATAELHAQPHHAWVFSSTSADGTVRVWSARDWSCLHILCMDAPDPRGHGMFLSALVASTSVFTACHDGVVRVYYSDAVLRSLAAPLPGTDVLPARLPAPAQTENGVDSATVPAITSALSSSLRLAHHTRAGPVSPPTSSRASSIAAAPHMGAMRLSGLARDLRFQTVLRQLIQIRSVSPDTRFKEECFRAAKFLSRLLEVELGAEVALSASKDPVTGEDYNHVVIARLGNFSRENVPTICFYGHYDIQPAHHSEGWKHPPFDMTLVNGYLYGRGVSDNKGPCLGFIYAAKDLLDSVDDIDDLPVNMVFVFEGEEETGSRGFSAALQRYQHWMQNVSMVVVSNTFWVGERVPCITVGMRGMINVSVEVSGPSRDVHSGNEGGVFNEPMSDLTKLLSTLVDSQSYATIPGFYDNAHEVSLSEIQEEVEARGEFSVAQFQAAIGVPALTTGKRVAEVLHRRWCVPALSITDVRVNQHEVGKASYGPTRFSVVPKSVVGHVSVRYVPGQASSFLIRQMHQHLQHEFSKLRSANTVTMTVRSSGSWWEADVESELMQCVEAAIESVWGQQPMHVREGGTMPVTSELENLLQAPAVLIPFGQSSDSTHLPNERMRQINLLKGRDVVRELLEGVGRMARDGMLPATSRKEFRARGDLTTQSVMTLGKVQELSRSGAVVMDNGPVVECLSKCASDAEAGRMGAPGTRSVAQQGGVTLRYEVGSASGCAGDHRH